MKNLWRIELAGVWLSRRSLARTANLVTGLLTVLGLALILNSPMAYGQGSEGRVSGTVRDASGAVIPGATVVLHNEASNAELKTSSDARGFYDFNYIAVATYTLKVSAQGFKESVLTGIHVAPGAILQEDAALQVGAQVEVIEVKGSAVNLIPKSTGGQIPVIGQAQIENESTIGRDSLELLTLLPGVVGGTGTPGSITAGFNGASGSGFQTVGGVNTEGINGFNVNGLRNDQNMVMLDNANTIDPGENGGFMVEPNMDMIQEFTVKMSGFEASQGGGGVIVEAVTKSGGSKLHGEGYWYARNAVFNANDWSNNQARISKPNSKFNYPGFNIGGPVRFPHSDFNKNNDKMFFFYGVEWQRQLADPGTQFRTVPTAAMRNGDFSGQLNTNFCQTNTQGVVTGGNYLSMPCILTDPATGKQANYGGVLNVLPPNEVTGAGQDVLNGTYVLPNFVDPSGNYNLAAHPLYPTNRIENSIRIDYNLTQNTRAFLRLAQNSDHEYYPYGLWASGLGDGWGGNVPRVSPVVGHDSGENASINVVKVINPTLTNEVQFNMGAINYPYKYADPSKVASTSLLQTLQGVNWAQGSGGSDFTRTVEIPGVWNGEPPNSQTWGQGDEYNGIYGNKTTFELTDNLTKVKGTHTLQFGFMMNHTRNDQNQANVNGNIWSNVGWAGVTSTGNVFGDLLDQSVYQWSQSTNDPDGMWRFWNYEWYAQDSWKVNRKLTVNYGARFAYFPPWFEARGEVATFNPAIWTAANDSNINDGVQVGSGYHLVANQAYIPANVRSQFAGGLPSSGGFPAPPLVVEPRLGFAYDVFGTGKTVLRAGGGVYEERDQGNTIFGAADNPPFEFSTSISSATRYNPAAANPAATGFGYYSTVNPLSSVGGISATMYDTHDHHGAENYSWNFTVDQDIGWKTILEVAYVGTVGRHLYIENIFSPIPLGAMWVPGTENPVAGASNSGTQNSYRHYKPFGAMDLLHHVSSSNYNALQATVRRNVTHGLTLLTSYTYSKTMGYSGGYNGTVDPFDSKLNYGLMSYSLPQMLNVSYIYQMPNAGAKYFSGSKVAGGFLDGWQVSGITNFQSGAPQSLSGIGTFNCYEGGVQNAGLCSNFNGNGVGWYGTPDRTLVTQLVMNPQKGANFHGVGSQWFNPAAITIPPVGQLGTTEEPQFLGPGSNNWDMTLFKTFKIAEHQRLELRIAAFDIFNRAQLDTPSQDSVPNPNINWELPAGATNFTQGTASAITNASATCSGGNTVGCIMNKHGHREMEVALKFYF
jgi:hypothetical protein